VLWRDYRQMLARRGIADPAPASPPTYCTVGDTTDVPGRP